ELVRYENGLLHIGAQTSATATPLAELSRSFNPLLASEQTPSSHFKWGFLGYFGYPLHQTLEQQRVAPESPGQLPDLWGGLYDWSIVTDHRQRWTRVFAASPSALRAARAALDQAPRAQAKVTVGSFSASLTANEYDRAFARAQQYIASGDCYQINFAKHYEAELEGHPFDLYQSWLQRQSAPFCAYLGIGNSQALVSLSPERFVRSSGGLASVSPIKGTRPRSTHSATDTLAKLALLSSDKDRAENLMIVDLLRNDLGRVAVPGSVQVTHLFEPVSFVNVHHLVSTIEASVRPGLGALDLVQALFPCGSVTGAPKIRAMDIINELEPVGRSAYCGAVGYIDASGEMDLSVTIRSAVINQQRIHLWGGGGLVAQSRAAAEQQEIEDKIGRLMRAAAR
ncbi:MAG: aminodeoxychorismate synthase component I, partial [Pseudomonadales bacterium]